jgi:RNA polymerase sigma-70 factor (ECF subfamily)
MAPSEASRMDSGADSGFDCVLRAWQAHEAELLGFLAHHASDADAAQDLLQEVFVKALRQGGGFCALDNPRAWLVQVARNALVDAGRLRRPSTELSDELPAPQAEERAPVEALDACIGRNLPLLGEDDRDIVQRCDLDGLTVRAYAESAGLSLPAAKARLLRARKRLRDALVEHCGVRFDPDGSVCCHAGPDGG